MNGDFALIQSYFQILTALATESASTQQQPAAEQATMIIAPPMPYLAAVNAAIASAQSSTSLPLALAAQNTSEHEAGAFTGDISVSMLKDCEVSYVILGHSERRQYYQESNEALIQRFQIARQYGLQPIFCIGESKAQFESQQTEVVLESQLEPLFANTQHKEPQLIIAYEPVWAIGTGLTAEVTQIEQVHQFILSFAARFGFSQEQVTLLYGGSVKPSNAKEILQAKAVDGVLVGGASLKAQDFYAIYQAAAA